MGIEDAVGTLAMTIPLKVVLDKVQPNRQFKDKKHNTTKVKLDW